MNEKQIREFQDWENNFNTTLALNDVEKISPYLSDDWVLLQPELRVSLQNDIAIVTSRGMNIGTYKDTQFNTEHWVTNIYKSENSKWICIMTLEAAVICS